MSEILNEEEKFRSFVLGLKEKNPSYTQARLATELESYEIGPKLCRSSLRWKINSILKRGTIKDKPRSGAPRTVRNQTLTRTVNKLLFLKKTKVKEKLLIN